MEGISWKEYCARWVSEGYANKTSSGEKKIISESGMRLAYKKPVVRCREEKGVAFIPLVDRRYNRKKVAANAKASSARSKDLFNPFTTPSLPDVLPGGTYLFITNIPRVQQQPEPHDGDPAPGPRREEIAKLVRFLVKRVQQPHLRLNKKTEDPSQRSTTETAVDDSDVVIHRFEIHCVSSNVFSFKKKG